MQPRLDAHLFEETPAVPVVVEGDTRQKQAVLTAAGVAGHDYHGEWNYDVGPVPTPKPQRTNRATRTTSV